MNFKVCYILSDVNKALAFEWHALKLKERGFDIHFILMNNEDSPMEKFLRENKFNVDRIKYNGKRNFFSALFKTIALLKKNKTGVISAHLLNAGLVGLFAGKLCFIKKRVYTRHHSTYHHEYAPKGVFIDKFINFLATDIIAISENVKKVLIESEGVKPEKIHLIHHGFLLKEFKDVDSSRVKYLKEKYHVKSSDGPVIGVVSRYFKLKGIQYTIAAFKQLLLAYPNAKLILCGAFGPDKDYIKDCLSHLPREKYTEIFFEEDNFALYKLFDVFVHVPDNVNCEAFGQIYIEALASGIPSVFTLSGVATEFIADNYNALVVDYKNSDQIYHGILKILSDDDLKNKLIENGYTSIKKDFELDMMIGKLSNLYNS